MKVIETGIQGLVLVLPRIFSDARGSFFESFSQREFDENVAKVTFVQDNQSFSKYGVVRGLHFQREPFAQSKLVRVVSGRVLDVVVDLRKDSQSFGKVFSVELSDENHLQLFIPKGFAHGFSVLSPEAIFQYKCDEYYAPDSEGGIVWDDPDLNIDWGLPVEDIIVSSKDALNPKFRDLNL